MKANFWIKKWENNDIGFHASEVNPFLARHLRKLSLVQGSRVFVPLCGKTLDIAWLLSHGLRVAGAELSELAIEQLFVELKIKPSVTTIGGLTRYSASNLDIFVGNIFDLTQKTLGSVKAVYDRAALVALPENKRSGYARHLAVVTDRAPQLIITYDYDQKQLNGPPFSVSNEEVSRLYGKVYDIILLESIHLTGGLRGKCAATENVWLLTSTFPESK